MIYSPDEVVDKFVSKSIESFERNPFDWKGTNEIKTIDGIKRSASELFGDYARSIRIVVH